MKIYCMSDIHGCLAEFDEALSLVLEHLQEPESAPGAMQRTHPHVTAKVNFMVQLLTPGICVP